MQHHAESWTRNQDQIKRYTSNINAERVLRTYICLFPVKQPWDQTQARLEIQFLP